jgi:hypothetical protein
LHGNPIVEYGPENGSNQEARMDAKKTSDESRNNVLQFPPSKEKRLRESLNQPEKGIEYTNRKGKTYYLHVGKTKKGNPRYHFAMEAPGELLKEIPEGYETYENPNAQVFLRKIQPKDIFDDEREILERALRAHADPSKYKIDIKGKVLTVFWADQSDFGMMMLAAFAGMSQAQEFRDKHMRYSSLLRFTLLDPKQRLFIAERYCFRGSIDSWMHLLGGGPDSLQTLVKRYVSHLGEESFYELM